jgi:preprotein translocase subunit SecD
MYKKRNMKIKLTFKIWLWIIIFILALVSIFVTPYFLHKGVLITSVEQNSSAFEQGIRQGQVITAIDGKPVTNLEDYSKIMQEKFISDEKLKITITTEDNEYVFYSNNSLGITVSNLPITNLKTGLDLSGGSRALVKAEDHKLTSAEVNTLVDMISNRLNVYGISDMTIRPVSDLAGNNYMLVEIAGATPKDLEDLISHQGKFEGKIGDEIVFIGGNQDIRNVAQGGQESGITSCEAFSGGYICQFRFAVTISPEAAERQAAITQNLTVISGSNGESYLSKPLDLYLDDKFYSNLSISSDLKGNPTTQILITGSGTGPTKDDAINAANEEMKKLKTILMTGSLPFKLEIVELQTVSPTLGQNFMKYIFIAGIVALILVAIIIFIRYRLKSSIFPLIICTSEIIITLGVAAFLNWDLDLPAIAGILAAIGTGVDDQIVVLDEAKQKGESVSIKQRIKRAFAIILGAYFTAVASLLPLWWAGAGLLKGFVFTTLVGITIGVLITRPAFADIVKITEK